MLIASDFPEAVRYAAEAVKSLARVQYALARLFDGNRKAQIALSTEPVAHQNGRCARLASFFGELWRGMSLLRARR